MCIFKNLNMSIESLHNLSDEQLIIGGATIYFVLALIYSYRSYRKIQNWPFVIGQLEYVSIKYIFKRADGGGAYEDVSYKYEVDGQKFTGTRLSPILIRGNVRLMLEKQIAKIDYVSEKQVKVFYNPKKPEKSYLVRESGLDIFRK